MKEFCEIIKVFLEKHLIPTVIAIGCSILSVALVPPSFWLNIKVGSTWFGVFCFCMYFTLIQIIIHTSKFINGKVSNGNYERMQNAKKEKEFLESLWTLIDEMSQEDYNYLMKFIKSNNSPIEIVNTFYSCGCLFNSDYINVTTKRQSEEKLEAINYSNPKNGAVKIPIDRGMFMPAIKQYKLKPDFYDILKYSYETYGRISHFSRDNSSE